MPAGLEVLPELALNLRWTWSHAADRLWQAIDPAAWATTKNPWLLLQIVLQERLEECARSLAFRQDLARLADLRAEYMTQPTWCSQCGPAQPPLTAFFCLEFGVAEALPLYAGGLGILAGDVLKTASDLGVPMVGVGLLYSGGYFRQVVDADGVQHELFPPNVPYSLPVTPAIDADGAQLRIGLALPGRDITVRVWQAQLGRVPLLLLDCNDPRNSAADRGITATLYPSGQEARFMQQMLLGIAGCRALTALGYSPEVYHLNEGHAALAAFERARSLSARLKLPFERALWACRAGNLFTTHTPIAAAFDRFAPELVLKYLRRHLADAGVGEAAFLQLGQCPAAGTGDLFLPAVFALRSCGNVNAVSRSHGEVSRRQFLPLYPRWPACEIPVEVITNGVHVPSWDSAWADELWTRACGKRRWHGPLEARHPSIESLDDRVLWDFKSRERRDLVDYARQRLARQLGQRGQEGPQLAARVLDPNALTLGFARRFTEYKRPNLLLHDPERLSRLLTDPARPVQLILAGKAHPEDLAGKAMIREWVQFSQRPGLRDRVVFLEDYDIDLAQQMVQGIDVWINTPRQSWEACGTSGMKILVNGGLNLSELDGWWAEAYSPEVGWALHGNSAGAAAERDNEEAAALYRLLEQQVIPCFFDRQADGIALRWVAMIRSSMARLAPQFSSNRMLREYFEAAYCPAAAAFGRRTADGARLSFELESWAAALHARWGEIRFSNLDCRRHGERLQFDVHVYLGELPVEGVAVELYGDPGPAEAGPAVFPMQRAAPIGGAVNAHIFTAEITSQRPPGDFTPRVVPRHPEARVPLEVNLIRWCDRPSPGTGLI